MATEFPGMKFRSKPLNFLMSEDSVSLTNIGPENVLIEESVSNLKFKNRIWIFSNLYKGRYSYLNHKNAAPFVIAPSSPKKKFKKVYFDGTSLKKLRFKTSTSVLMFNRILKLALTQSRTRFNK
eukprot:NODE_170_length_16226_cov_0.451169.p12 type:complete len:124 gc:universal NODE_170_length_16226_cov_0.451169:9290-8919(-)